jgi:hypothetical protein
MKLMRIRNAELAVWRLVFAGLILAVVCDGIGIWMGWIATH